MKRNIFIIIIFVAIIVIFIFIGSDQPKEEYVEQEPIEELTFTKDTEEKELAAVSENVIIDVKGEVKKPGVYELNYNERVNDAIKIAGGFTSLADETKINLAQIVRDEMVIIVPKEGEESSEVLFTVTEGGGGIDKVDINHATQAEIETINGIGPSKASTIMQYRDENGPFKQIEDLLNVNGIGQKTLDNMEDYIIIR